MVFQFIMTISLTENLMVLFGDLCGSVLGDDIMSEVQWIMGKNKSSMGQQSIFLINKLFGIAQSHLSFKDIFKQYVNEDGTRKEDESDVWEKLIMFIGLTIWEGKFPQFLENLPGTFLFDELDKSLDILNVYNLYANVLPDLLEKKNGCSGDHHITLTIGSGWIKSGTMICITSSPLMRNIQTLVLKNWENCFNENCWI